MFFYSNATAVNFFLLLFKADLFIWFFELSVGKDGIYHWLRFFKFLLVCMAVYRENLLSFH